MRTLKFVIFVLFFISFLILFDNELYAADTFDTSFAFVDVIREDGSIRRLPPLPDVFKNNDFYIFYNNNDYWATVFHGYSISNMYYYNTKELYISKNSDSDIIYYSKYKLSGSNWLEESKEQNVVFTSQKDMNYLTICASTFDIYKEGNIVFNKNLSSECWTDLDLSSFYSFEYNGITRYFSVPDNAVDFFIACYTYNRFTLYYTTEPAYWYVRDGRDYKDVYARNLDNTAYIPDSYFIIDYYSLDDIYLDFASQSPWRVHNNNTHFSFKKDTLILSTVDIYDDSGSLFYGADFDSNHDVDVPIEWVISAFPDNYTTSVPVVLSSNYLPVNIIENYECYYCYFEDSNTDGINEVWEESFLTTHNLDNGSFLCAFCCNAYKNGVYVFKFINKSTGQEYLATFNLSIIVVTGDNYPWTNTDSSGFFTPLLSVDFDNDTNTATVKTQSFFEDDIRCLDCDFAFSRSIDIDVSELNWKEGSLNTFNKFVNDELNYITFNFYQDFFEDGTVYCRFYNKITDSYTYSSILLDFDYLRKYNDMINGVTDDTNEILLYFQERFGFLTYPFVLMGNLFNRISHIRFDEPKIFIPEIREPSTNKILINKTTFNFNDFLDGNENFRKVHDFYLIAVDAILILGLLDLTRRKVLGVFSK